MSEVHRAFPRDPLFQDYKSLGNCPHGWLGWDFLPLVGWLKEGGAGAGHLFTAGFSISNWESYLLSDSNVPFVAASSLPQGRLPLFSSPCFQINILK